MFRSNCNPLYVPQSSPGAPQACSREDVSCSVEPTFPCVSSVMCFRASPSPLQEVVSRPVAGSKGPSFSCSYDRSQSFQPSQSNLSSFSVYEDSQESSFAPFHDSWASRSKNASGAACASFRRTEEPQLQSQSLVPGDREPGLCYRAPLGAPVVPRTEENHLANATIEQSFTQFDIRHPGLYEPASTPMVERVGRDRNRRAANCTSGCQFCLL